MINVGVGFKLISDTGAGNIGSVSIIDSSFSNVGTAAVVISPPNSAPASGSSGVILEKVSLSGVTAAVQDTNGKTLLSGSSGMIDQWALGPVYECSTTARTFSQGGKIGSYRRHSTLVDADGLYFERPKPQYQSHGVGDFVHIKDLGVTGDGSTDDTANFQAALYAAQGRILFIDAGSYILTSTVNIPPGSKSSERLGLRLLRPDYIFKTPGKQLPPPFFFFFFFWFVSTYSYENTFVNIMAVFFVVLSLAYTKVATRRSCFK